jgi:hypothetical protein
MMKRWTWMTTCGLACATVVAWAAVVPPPPPAVGPGGLPKNAVALKKLDVQPKLLTPTFQVNPVPPASKNPRYWYQMTLHFDTHMEWMDDLDFRCYVLLKPKPGSGNTPHMLLRGDVTLVNVAKGKHKCDFFVHPSTLLRYGEVEAVAVVLSKAEQVIGMMSQPPSPKRWWEDYQPVPNMVLKRGDTPWALINYDDYEQVKESTPSAR